MFHIVLWRNILVANKIFNCDIVSSAFIFYTNNLEIKFDLPVVSFKTLSLIQYTHYMRIIKLKFMVVWINILCKKYKYIYHESLHKYVWSSICVQEFTTGGRNNLNYLVLKIHEGHQTGVTFFFDYPTDKLQNLVEVGTIVCEYNKTTEMIVKWTLDHGQDTRLFNHILSNSIHVILGWRKLRNNAFSVQISKT